MQSLQKKWAIRSIFEKASNGQSVGFMGCCGSAAVAVGQLIPISIVGLPGVGKTSVVEALAGGYNSHDPPTETLGIMQRSIVIHERSYLFYDVSGYTLFSAEWIECIEKSLAVIIVFDPKMLDEGRAHVEFFYNVVAPTLIKKRLPTLTLVNKYDNSDLSELEALMKSKLGTIPMKLATISHLNEALLHEFEWIEAFVT
jgi:GTPase SAR1 family protein